MQESHRKPQNQIVTFEQRQYEGSGLDDEFDDVDDIFEGDGSSLNVGFNRGGGDNAGGTRSRGVLPP